MNSDIFTCDGYMELGMEEEAKREFLKVRPDDPAYARARAELLMFASPLDGNAQIRNAEEGLALIRSRPRIVNRMLVNNTALCLHFAGQTREAYDLTLEFEETLEWNPSDFYGFACYASRLGEFDEAAENLVEGMSKRLSPAYAHMLADPDLQALFRHASDGKLKLETALSLANPRFGAAVDLLLQLEPECDGMLFREMSSRFQKHAKINLQTYMYELSPTAPGSLRREFREFLADITRRTASLVRRGIERAREMVLDVQLDFAVAAARRGDFLSARHHSILSISARPDSFELFDAALSPLGLDWFFDDIKRARAEDPSFRQMLESTFPFEAISVQCRMEMLEDCGSLAKATTFWILSRSILARYIDGTSEAKAWHIEVIRRWPEDPAAYHNLLLIYENEHAWNEASILLANVPPSFSRLSAAQAHVLTVGQRKSACFPKYTAFHGQPDLGGIVVLPGKNSGPSTDATPSPTGDRPPHLKQI